MYGHVWERSPEFLHSLSALAGWAYVQLPAQEMATQALPGYMFPVHPVVMQLLWGQGA